jgi:hypothetical protein
MSFARKRIRGYRSASSDFNAFDRANAFSGSAPLTDARNDAVGQ